MHIAIIGAGNVGGTLGTRWAQHGHQIIFGVRDPHDAKVQQVLGLAGASARATSVHEAAAATSIVLLATPWVAAQEAIAAAGNLAGKILIDATNPVVMSQDGLTQGLLIGHSTSAAEQIAQWATGARVVKALNTTGWPNMANPLYGTQRATMFICGDDVEAKATVAQLTEELGFEVVDTGALSTARWLEPLAMLWMHLCVGLGWGPEFAFKILTRAHPAAKP
jgi:predicted dinucleotide-binding enzyme